MWYIFESSVYSRFWAFFTILDNSWDGPLEKVTEHGPNTKKKKKGKVKKKCMKANGVKYINNCLLTGWNNTMDFFLLSQEPAFAKLSFLKTFLGKFYGVYFAFP